MKISYSTLLRICSYISLAICFLPAVDYYCPWYVTMIPAAITIILTLRIHSDISTVLKALLYISGLAFLLLWFTKRQGDAGNFLINFYITFLPALLAIQLNKTIYDDTFFRDYLRVAFFFIAITCVTTMIGHVEYPMASRELASGTAIYDTTKYLKLNIGGYEFIYALVMLIPLTLWQISSEKGFYRIFSVAVLVLMISCIYSSQYTLALICTAIAFLIVLMHKNRNAAIVLTVVICVFMLFNGLKLLADFFYWASENVGTPYVRDRLLQVAQLFSGESIHTETSDARIEHYIDQLNAFSASPIIGANLLEYSKDAVSGHSLILDMLGAGGIFATGIMLALFRALYRICVPVYGKRASKAVRSVWATAAVVALLNPVTFPAIATVVFTCCMCVERVVAK